MGRKRKSTFDETKSGNEKYVRQEDESWDNKRKLSIDEKNKEKSVKKGENVEDLKTNINGI